MVRHTHAHMQHSIKTRSTCINFVCSTSKRVFAADTAEANYYQVPGVASNRNTKLKVVKIRYPGRKFFQAPVFRRYRIDLPPFIFWRSLTYPHFRSGVIRYFFCFIAFRRTGFQCTRSSTKLRKTMVQPQNPRCAVFPLGGRGGTLLFFKPQTNNDLGSQGVPASLDLFQARFDPASSYLHGSWV